MNRIVTDNLVLLDTHAWIWLLTYSHTLEGVEILRFCYVACFVTKNKVSYTGTPNLQHNPPYQRGLGGCLRWLTPAALLLHSDLVGIT
ncbi:type II toxin-antitoxin system VapC family toxin [Candidatus Poribacteria bacterium]|nr:type II toxin-antitoxin system VapC family toxin [Candidatus Poribacteria bacterium]